MNQIPDYGNNDQAVSPVIGVMLILVVTVIIAAIVAAFAGGLGQTSEPAPVASIDVTIDLNYDPGWGGLHVPYMLFHHRGGDTLKTQDLQIVTYYTVPQKYLGTELPNAGKIIKHTVDGSLSSGGANAWNQSMDPFTEPQINNDGVPTLNEVGVDSNDAFGTYLWRPGRTIESSLSPDTASADMSRILGFDITDKTDYGFSDKAVVHVTIVHKPSGKFIYDKDVEVLY
ncbi:MAG: type IV pilin N-terminal domain-containing protein [Methanoregula sp.]|jgi:FlaG/FlaF family flagellin (archaellin)